MLSILFRSLPPHSSDVLQRLNTEILHKALGSGCTYCIVLQCITDNNNHNHTLARVGVMVAAVDMNYWNCNDSKIEFKVVVAVVCLLCSLG